MNIKQQNLRNRTGGFINYRVNLRGINDIINPDNLNRNIFRINELLNPILNNRGDFNNNSYNPYNPNYQNINNHQNFNSYNSVFYYNRIRLKRYISLRCKSNNDKYI